MTIVCCMCAFTNPLPLNWEHLQELSPAEREAVFAFLSLNVEEFAALAPYEIPLKVSLAFVPNPAHLSRPAQEV